MNTIVYILLAAGLVFFGGTTLAAALLEGRRAIGSEKDPEAHAVAMERLGASVSREGGQGALF